MASALFLGFRYVRFSLNSVMVYSLSLPTVVLWLECGQPSQPVSETPESVYTPMLTQTISLEAISVWFSNAHLPMCLNLTLPADKYASAILVLRGIERVCGGVWRNRTTAAFPLASD